jgi:hypothetical protein
LENFNNKIWRTSVAVRALGDLMFHTRMCGAMRWVPSWNLDRLLGLYVQAMSYEPGRVIGHSFRAGPQYYFGRVFQADRVGRFIWAADALLLKRFPRYSYFWNLLFEQIRGIPGISFAIVKKRLGGRKSA